MAKSAGGFSREHANHIVKTLLARYEPELPEKPIGKPFDEVFDMKSLKPIAEWQGMYEEVKEELITLGLSLDRLR